MTAIADTNTTTAIAAPPASGAAGPAAVRPIRFLRRGEPVALFNVAPDRTLLEVLREDLHACGTKEGCGEGDCGACTVVLAEAVAAAEDGTDGAAGNGTGAGRTRLRWRAINSCIRLAHSIDGLALWTVEDLQADPLLLHPAGLASAGTAVPLHPAQQAMVDCHASQCGFCTPGIVMSMYTLLR